MPLRLALGATALLALAGCSDNSATASDDATATIPSSATPSTASTSMPAPTPTASPEKPRLIGYAGGESPGVEVRKRSDARNLTGAPAAFQLFIGGTAEQNADASTCSDGYVGVTVQTLRTDGYAVGGVNDCGGYAALWVVVDGSWKEVAGTQEMWDCAVLERYEVPSDVAGTACYDYDAQRERNYQQD